MGLIQLFLEQPENKQKILRLKAQGMPDKRIAAEVGLSELLLKLVFQKML